MSAHANTGSVLDRILDARRAAVDHRKRVLPETALKYGVKAASPVRDFSGALSRDGFNVIAELKPASPSRGVIRDPFDAVALGQSLAAAGAAALSVLTEPEFFGGSLKNMRDARKEIDARAKELLSLVQLDARLDHLPDELSGGERQRVAIARALSVYPPVLLADEPTGNLDTATGSEILKLIHDLHQRLGATVLMVTHDTAVAESCERTIHIRDGRIHQDVRR